EADGLYNPFREGTRVYVTLPGGHREGFTFHPRPERYVPFIFHPEFVPDSGVTSRLSVPDVSLLPRGDGYYVGSADVAYNPASLFGGGGYTLTTKDATAYDIDAASGDLTRVTDRNGNTLTFSDMGIQSSAGVGVTFGRDPQGRITSVTDPMGKSVVYQY